MSPILYSIVASAALLGQVIAEDVDAGREREIRVAISQLGATDYSTREQAYRALWRHGLAAESALKRAAKSQDGETRLRAKRLLRDFEYGILPGTDAETQRLIRDFRDGVSEARGTAFQRLLQQQRIDILERLIRLESDPQFRRVLIVQMFQDERIVDRFIRRDRIEALIEAIGGDQSEEWKRSLTIQLMFAPNMLARLAETGSLDKLLQLIRDETDAQARQTMLVALFRTPGVAVVLARNELAFVLDTLRAEPDQKFRGALLGEIFANQQAAQAIVAHKQLDAILTFSREQTDAASQQKLIELILASAPVIESLLKEGGVERVIELVSKEQDPVRRGRLLGVAISTSGVRTFLQRNGLSELAIKLAKEETNEAARHEFLQALLHDTSFVYSLNNEATVGQLWQLIKADKNTVWRSQALIVLLQSHRANALLRDKEEAAWILKLASDDAAGPVREDIMRFLFPNQEAQRALIANGHFDTMLTLARELPIRSRGEILANFLAGAPVAEHLKATKQIELLITIAKEEPDAAARQLCLQGVFRNSVAMTALLEAGHYTTFRDLIQSDADPARRASLFAAFVQNYQVMEELAKRGDAKLLLAYAETDVEGARRLFLPRLFQNQRAVALLIDEGYFDWLVVLAKQDDGANFDEFLAVPKVIEHLVATKQFDLFVDFATGQADDNTRRNLLRNVFTYSKTVEALIASEHFDALLRLIRAERDPMWRASLLGPVVSSSAVITHFAAAKKLDEFLSIISDEPELVVRTRLTSYLTGRSDTMNILIERGQLDALIALVNRHMTGQTRGTTLANILANSKALDRLKADQRAGLLLSFTRDADAEFTAAYISRLYLSVQAADLLVEQGYYGDVLRIATTERDVNVRAALLGRLLYSPRAVQELIARNDVAKLVSILKSGVDENSRRDYLRAVCSNELLIDEMLKTELFASFVETLCSESDAETRHRQLATLVYSERAIARLVADEQLEQILDDAIADSDQRNREDWLSIVIQRTSTFAALVKLGYGEKLLDATESRLSIDRQRSLLRSVFSNQNAIQTLIEQGKFERLIAAAKRNGGSKFGDLLRSPIVVDHLVETKQLAVMVRFIAEEPDPSANYSVLYALLSNAKARKELLESDQFETLCEAVVKIPEVYRQASLLSTMFSAPDVTQHYIETKTLDRLFSLIEQKVTPSARSQILSSMFGRHDVIDPLIEQGQFEELLRITSEHTSGEARQQLLAQLLTSSKVLTRLVADEKIDLLLSHATEADGSVSVPFVSRLFTSRAAIDLLIDRGHFAELYKLATSSEDAKTRRDLLGQLVANPKAIEQLVASDKLAVVVDYANDETDLATRRAYLGQICSNQRLITELARSELFDELVRACDSEPDSGERRRRFAALLHCAAAIERFAAAERLESLITSALAEPDKNYRHSWLSNSLSNPSAFAALMKHGFGDQLIEAAERELDPSRLQYAFRSMLSSSEVISNFAKSGQHQFLFKLAAGDADDNRVSYLLSRIASNEDALRAITRAGELNQLLERVAKGSNESYRQSLQRQIFTSYGTVSAFAEQDKLDTLFDLIRGTENSMLRASFLQAIVFNDRTRTFVASLSDPAAFVSLVADEDQQRRSGVVMRLASDTNLRRRWIEAGSLAHLEKMVELLPNEYREQRHFDLFYAPSGVIGQLLRQGKFADAEKMLYKYRSDRALSWLVSYRTSRGQLAAEIERLRQIPLESRNAYQSRHLLYLLRANGDLPGATAVAEAMGDPRLLRALHVEQQQWADAAKLQAESPLPPPVDVAQTTQQDDDTRRIEQLGQLASYHRLAGDEAAAQNAIAEILAFASQHDNNSQLVWHCAEALLLNDCVDDGLRLVKNSRPLVAFHQYAQRHDYAAAFGLFGVSEDFVADRAWYDALPFGTAQSEVQKRFGFAITIAGTLRVVGRDQAAESVLSVLEAIINETPTQGNFPTQNYLWQWYSGGLYRIGLNDRAWNAAAKVVSGPSMRYPPGVLSDIFASRVGEAQAWWLLFHQQNSSETPQQRLARIDAVMNPASTETLQSFPDLVRQAISFGESGQSESYWRGLADNCIALGQQELAIECFEWIADKSTDTTVAYANAVFAAERWANAAEAYYAAYSQDYDRLGLLFLAGVAKQRAGQAEEGQAWQRLADLLAFTPRMRYQLALTLTERGIVDAANDQWHMMLRTAPFESLELNDAARQLAMSAYRSEPETAARLWQHYMLGDVRPAFWFLNEVSYLTVPALVHKLRAMDAIGRSDFESAEREMRLGLAMCPGDTVIAEEVVPLLDAAGQREIGDRFIAQVVEHYEKVCEAHPNFAQLHNNLAWATARCHRHLDEALLHATKAVELDPNSAAYIDTLAEVHFHLGDRDTAIHWSEQAVALRPMGASLQTQLTRFRTAPLPTP